MEQLKQRTNQYRPASKTHWQRTRHCQQ